VRKCRLDEYLKRDEERWSSATLDRTNFLEQPMQEKAMLTSYAAREAEENEVTGLFRAECFDESDHVAGDILDGRYVEVVLDAKDVQALIDRIAPAHVPKRIQEKVHFRLYHDLKTKGILPEGFPVPCNPFVSVDTRLPSHLDGKVEGETVRVRVVRFNGRREEARFNLLRGGFDHDTFALGWKVVRWAPLDEPDENPEINNASQRIMR
jgi:hypothetical protein